MNKWDDLRWSEMREALSGLIINFERLSQISSRSFSFEAKEEILDASRQFIRDAFSSKRLPSKEESRLCQRIVNKIDKALSSTITQRQKTALRLLLERANSKGFELPHGEVQRALKKLDEPEYLKGLRAAALRRISPPQVVANGKIARIKIDEKTFPNGQRPFVTRVVIESKDPQMVDAGFTFGKSGARGYGYFRLFCRALYSVYREAGGTARYTHDYENDSYSGEAIDFISETIAQTCCVLNNEMIDSVCPSNQGHAIADAITDFLKSEA
jgi:hypothetical protein